MLQEKADRQRLVSFKAGAAKVLQEVSANRNEEASGRKSIASISRNIFLNRLPAQKQCDPYSPLLWRHPITGEVTLAHPDEDVDVDFRLVDLWTRNSVVGTLDQLQHETFFFRPIPMVLRSWCLTQIMTLPANIDKTGKQMTAIALRQSINDHRRVPFKLHSVAFYAPMLFCAALTGDLGFMIMVDVCFLLNLVVCVTSNNFKMYRYSRDITVPFRLGILCYLVVQVNLGQMLQFGEYFEFLSCIVILILIFVDFCYDGMNQVARYLECSYEVLEELPGRVYVCRRHGRPTVGPKGKHVGLGRSFSVPECITGIPRDEWEEDSSLVLIANCFGLLCFLVTLDRSDWKNLQKTYRASNNTPVMYVGLNTYSRSVQSFDIFDLLRSDGYEAQVRMRFQQKEAKHKEGPFVQLSDGRVVPPSAALPQKKTFDMADLASLVFANKTKAGSAPGRKLAVTQFAEGAVRALKGKKSPLVAEKKRPPAIQTGPHVTIKEDDMVVEDF